MLELLCKTSEERYLSSFARTCLVGETIEDGEEGLDPSSDDMQMQPMKDSVDLQKLTAAEQESLTLPQRARIAIRRLHRQFGHPTPQTLRAILKAGSTS